MADDEITWVSISRLSKRAWQGKALTREERQQVRERLEDGRLQARAAAYREGVSEPIIQCPIEPSFWKQQSLLFTKRMSTYAIEMHESLRTKILELSAWDQFIPVLEINKATLDALLDELALADLNKETLVETRDRTVDTTISHSPPNSTGGLPTGIVLLTAAQVRERVGAISDMTLWRWLGDESISFPKPIFIKTRRYWSEAALSAWEATGGKRPALL